MHNCGHMPDEVEFIKEYDGYYLNLYSSNMEEFDDGRVGYQESLQVFR